ncbi:MAG TPA: hypothetical protein VE569_00450 [Acidimicrobiia bacterium]|nr:hypothetical protein [Acidimicrobiia bacterium]
MKVVVRRSALKMWLIAMGGIPLLVISLDVLTQRRITRWLTDIIFRPDDTQIYEPRDVIYAWVMFLFAAFLVLWGLRELFAPTKVVECRDEGLALRIKGPFRSAAVIPWDNIRDLGGAEINDEGDRIPLFVVGVFSRDSLPDSPWGSRWVSPNELGMLAQDWSEEPQEIANRVADYAAGVQTRLRMQAASRVWKE